MSSIVDINITKFRSHYIKTFHCVSHSLSLSSSSSLSLVRFLYLFDTPQHIRQYYISHLYWTKMSVTLHYNEDTHDTDTWHTQAHMTQCTTCAILRPTWAFLLISFFHTWTWSFLSSLALRKFEQSMFIVHWLIQSFSYCFTEEPLRETGARDR